MLDRRSGRDAIERKIEMAGTLLLGREKGGYHFSF